MRSTAFKIPAVTCRSLVPRIRGAEAIAAHARGHPCSHDGRGGTP